MHDPQVVARLELWSPWPSLALMTARLWAPVRSSLPLGSMPRPDLVVIDERPEGVFLLGLTANGEFAGDTWHRSVEEAKDQAAHQFGANLRWTSIPESESDPVQYAVRAHAGMA